MSGDKKPAAPYRLTYETGAKPSRPAANPAPAPSRPASRESIPPHFHKAITLAIVILAALCMGLALATGSTVTAIVVTVTCLTMLQGLWYGGAAIAGLLAGMVLAVLFSGLTGRALEGVTHSLFATDGLANRFASRALAAVIILAVTTVPVSILTRRWLKKRPGWRAVNRYVGAGMGLVEGVILSLAILWIPQALEPIASAQVAAHKADASRPANPVAERIVSWAGAVRQSSFAPIADATNPIPNVDLLQLASDFALVSTDPKARDHLLNSDPIKQIQDLPSMKSAMERVSNDPDLSAMVSDRGITADDVVKFLNSPLILEIIDHSTIVDDMKPLADDLASAIREAKSMVGR